MNNRQERHVYLSVDEPFVVSIQKDILGDNSGSSVEDWLTSVAEKAMSVASEGADPSQMSLLITGDDTVHSLNASSEAWTK